MSGRRSNNRDIQPQQQSRRELIVEQMSRSFAGPIPPPEILEKYNSVVPNAAERILAMAEKQQEHRQGLEKEVIFGNVKSQKHGLFCGFVVAMTAIIGGIWLVANGRETTGLTAIITALASLVAVFVYGRYTQKKDLQNKPKPLDS